VQWFLYVATVTFNGHTYTGTFATWDEYADWRTGLAALPQNNPGYLSALNNQLNATIEALEEMNASDKQITAFINENSEFLSENGYIPLQGGNFEFLGLDIFPGMGSSAGCINDRCDVSGIGTLDFSIPGHTRTRSTSTLETRTISRWVLFSTALLITSLAILSTTSFLAPGREARALPPVVAAAWRLDLRALGFVRDPPREELDTSLQLDPICFLANDTVVVTFATREAPATLPRRGETGPSLPFRLRALFVDTKSGQLRTTHEWPASSYDSRVLPGTNGRFVVLTPDKLMLYSPPVELVKELDISLSRRAIVGGWRPYVSPSGRAIVINYEPKMEGHGWECEWINTEDLTVVERWTGRGFGGLFDNISDEVLVGMGVGIRIREPNAPWREICWSSPQHRCGMDPQFISNDVLFTYTDAGTLIEFSLIRRDGTILFRQDFPPSATLRCRRLFSGLYPARPSADGRRFALPIGKLHGGSEFFDIGSKFTLMQVMVFDLASRGWIARVEAKPLRVTSLWGLALSPDGSLLAFIDQDCVLWLFHIPETTAVPSA
jgi:hypothetical protein